MLEAQLQKMLDSMTVSEKLQDGKYRLPDRRILSKKGKVFTLTGHRSKAKLRDLEKLTVEKLRGRYRLAFGKEANPGLGKDELIRAILPRPTSTFHAAWLDFSQDREASYLRYLLQKAEKIN